MNRELYSKMLIIFEILMSVYSFTVGIIEKDIDQFVIGLLFITVATTEYCYSKIIAIKDRDLKRKDEIINILSKNNSNNKGENI